MTPSADCGDEAVSRSRRLLERSPESAYDYYKAYSPEAAVRFLMAYEKAIETIQYNPYICRQRQHGWRQMLIKGYPNYSIFYQELPKFWLFGGIVSTVQDPDTVQARLLIRETIEKEN